jgi:hypothetical protein
VSSCLGHPLLCVGRSQEFKEPTKQAHSIALAQSEAGGVRCQLIRECSWIVRDDTDRVHNELGNGFWIFVVPQKVGRDA